MPRSRPAGRRRRPSRPPPSVSPASADRGKKSARHRRRGSGRSSGRGRTLDEAEGSWRTATRTRRPDTRAQAEKVHGPRRASAPRGGRRRRRLQGHEAHVGRFGRFSMPAARPRRDGGDGAARDPGARRPARRTSPAGAAAAMRASARRRWWSPRRRRPSRLHQLRGCNHDAAAPYRSRPARVMKAADRLETTAKYKRRTRTKTHQGGAPTLVKEGRLPAAPGRGGADFAVARPPI